ncbi:hypothetical protein MRX96_026277 [Rhipicephalus microplus]
MVPQGRGHRIPLQSAPFPSPWPRPPRPPSFWSPDQQAVKAPDLLERKTAYLIKGYMKADEPAEQEGVPRIYCVFILISLVISLLALLLLYVKYTKGHREAPSTQLYYQQDLQSREPCHATTTDFANDTRLPSTTSLAYEMTTHALSEEQP